MAVKRTICRKIMGLVLISSCGAVADEKYDKNREDLAFAIGFQAYLYAFPLYEMERTVAMLTDPAKRGVPGHAPLGSFFHTKRLLTPRDRFVVSPNNDTLYSSAGLDLQATPYLLHIPAMGDRYYSFQMINAWTEVVAIVSNRTRGFAAGDYCIVGPDWHQELPANVEIIRSQTNLVWIIGRILIGGADDIAPVRSLQEHCSLTPLIPEDQQIPVQKRSRIDDSDIPESVRFFDRVGRYFASSKPKAHEKGLHAWFHEVGITHEGLDREKLDKAIIAGLERAGVAAKDFLANALIESGKKINGWVFSSGCDEHADHYVKRAVVARQALAALTPEEALYPTTQTDADGNQLSGANNYRLHFAADALPPVNAFWSLSIYDQESRSFVDNCINRYSIGDRTHELAYNDDGSLTIYIQRDCPFGNESNWLPAPAGNFYLVMRLYNPRQEVLNGTWEIPVVAKS